MSSLPVGSVFSTALELHYLRKALHKKNYLFKYQQHASFLLLKSFRST